MPVQLRLLQDIISERHVRSGDHTIRTGLTQSLYIRKLCNGRLANEGDGFLLGAEVTAGYFEVAVVYWSLVHDRVEWWDFCVFSCAHLDQLTI